MTGPLSIPPRLSVRSRREKELNLQAGTLTAGYGKKGKAGSSSGSDTHASAATADALSSSYRGVGGGQGIPGRRKEKEGVALGGGGGGTTAAGKLSSQQQYPPSPSRFSSLSFRWSQFMCHLQGEVQCTVLGGGLSYEQAVRHLETYALSQFEIQNRPRFFVSRDQEGNVYYMKFASSDDGGGGSSSGGGGGDNRSREEEVKDSSLTTSHAPSSSTITTTSSSSSATTTTITTSNTNTIRLEVYGLSPISDRMQEALKQLLNDRLIELAARAISGVVTRSGTINAANLSYVKLLGDGLDKSSNDNNSGRGDRKKIEGGGAGPGRGGERDANHDKKRHNNNDLPPSAYLRGAVKAYYALPQDCVNDLHIFLTLLEAVLMEGGGSGLLGKIGVTQSRTVGLEELVHPATFGYETRKPPIAASSSSTSSGSGSGNSGGGSGKLLPLMRKSAVLIEKLDHGNVSPVFFGREDRFRRLAELAGAGAGAGVEEGGSHGVTSGGGTTSSSTPAPHPLTGGRPRQHVWQQQDHT